MRDNILFAALLVIILTVGFYFVPVGIFLDDENTVAETVIARELNQEQAIYLTADKSPSPMDIYDAGRSQPVKGLTERRCAASALAAAMSRYSDSTVIPAEEGERLVNQWRITGSGLFCVSKWKHKNLKGNTQYMDCVIDPDGLSIHYIRFYTDDEPKLSAYDMNAALDKLDDYSRNFYTDLGEYEYDLEAIYTPGGNIPEDPYLVSDLASYPQLLETEYPALDYYSLYECFTQRYDLMVSLITDNGLDSPLTRFWLAPLSMMNVSIGWSSTNTVFSTLNRVMESCPPMTASYTAQQSRIWQTISLVDEGSVTLIYNIGKDEVEGFFVT